jgi:hypothetical protein
LLSEGRGFMRKLILLFFICVNSTAYSNTIVNQAPDFVYELNNIAFMGFYFTPKNIYKSNSDSYYTSPGKTLLYNIKKDFQPYNAVMQDVTAAAMEMSEKDGLSLIEINPPKIYQKALLLHIYQPDKYLYNPKIGKLCGDKPYILIGVISYDGPFSRAVKVRESLNGQKINYWHHHSVLEEDLDMMIKKEWKRVVAVELFLVSTQTGELLWQSNGVASRAYSVWESYVDPAKNVLDDEFKQLSHKGD